MRFFEASPKGISFGAWAGLSNSSTLQPARGERIQASSRRLNHLEQPMFGLIVIVIAVAYLLLSIAIVKSARRHARNTGKNVKYWGWGAALVMWLIPFWDWLPTVAVHQYYCATEAGFWVYKTPEQWKLENPGVMDGLRGYTNSRTVEIQITSPRSIRFLAIIREFDQLIAAMDTLWLACIIDDTHYAVEAYQWKRRILRLAGQIRTLATRAILAARKKENAEIAAEEREPKLINELSATPHRELESTSNR